MSFWEEHKKLVIGLGAALLILLVLRPSFSEGRPGVVSLVFGSSYNKAAREKKSNSTQINKYYNPRHTRMSRLISEAMRENTAFSEQFRNLRNYVLFIPPMPYKLKDFETETQKKLSFLTIHSEHIRSKLLQYLQLRNIKVNDEYFGIYTEKSSLPEVKQLPLLLRQLAMIDDLLRKAANCGMREVVSVNPLGPFEQGPIGKPNFLKVYPIRFTISAPVESIMQFVNQLDGFHGKVAEFADPDDPDHKRLIVNIGRKNGLTNENLAGGAAQLFFTIFSENPDPKDGLTYKCRAQIIKLNEESCVAEIMEDTYPPPEKANAELEHQKRPVDIGDQVSTNFYQLLDLSIRAEQPSEDNRLTNDITAEISVASIGLLQEAQNVVENQNGPPSGTKMQRPPNRRFGGY